MFRGVGWRRARAPVENPVSRNPRHLGSLTKKLPGRAPHSNFDRGYRPAMTPEKRRKRPLRKPVAFTVNRERVFFGSVFHVTCLRYANPPCQDILVKFA